MSGTPELQGLTGTVSFTVGVYTDNKPANGFMRLDQVEVSGAAIPESAPFGLVACVLALSLGLKCRNHRSS
ncbi:hypothetical protein [Puniceicoccus vermicola]|uniref:Uncharacterized protein n=1 Tax=Puniceicoccus vermicola TaxID=388746 RepID=A0A7X1AZ94_9BACT|nr:hypothetical protein [Puniceicoccus vermicola]MBC2602697.1 hypothetical protein [Puniceicoccus vermicola]